MTSTLAISASARQRRRALLQLIAVLVALITGMSALPASAAPRDTRRPKAHITTSNGTVLVQSGFATLGRELLLLPGRITGTATDDRSGVAYINLSVCPARPATSGWTCRESFAQMYGITTNDMQCKDRRRRCTWSSALPPVELPMTPGVYLVTAEAVDRRGKISRSTAPVDVIVL